MSESKENALVARVLKQSAQRPDSVAIVDRFGSLTYGELGKAIHEGAANLDRAEQNAIAITSAGHRGAVITMLAALAAGVTFVPVHERESASRAKRVVEEASNAIERMQRRPAFVLATSGSTGQPKLVPVNEANLLPFVDWSTTYFNVTAGTVVGNVSPLSFDLSTFDIYAVLGVGGRLVFPPAGLLNARTLLNSFNHEGVTHIYGVPTAWRLLQAATTKWGGIPTLTTAMSAGESLTVGLMNLLHAAFPAATFYNLYGPVEANVVAAHRVSETDGIIPIGKPVAGASLALYDEALNSVIPLNCSGQGELLISGPSLLSAYLGPSPETPSVTIGEDRWYRSGDWVSRDSDGVYTFQYRLGRQRKRKGYLVEPAEVETAAQRVLGCRTRAFFRPVASSAEPVLILGVASNSKISSHQIAELKRALPPFLWPDEVYNGMNLVFNRNGKPDWPASESSVARDPARDYFRGVI